METRRDFLTGAAFAGFRISGGTNTAFRTMDFTSLCLFRDPQRPLPKTERAKRGVQVFPNQPQGHNTGAGRLPFPNRADTMMPPRKRIAGLEFRLPEEDAASWDELAFRLDGGEWIPLAQGGARIMLCRTEKHQMCSRCRPSPVKWPIRQLSMTEREILPP